MEGSGLITGWPGTYMHCDIFFLSFILFFCSIFSLLFFVCFHVPLVPYEKEFILKGG